MPGGNLPQLKYTGDPLVPRIPISYIRRNAWALSLGKFYVGLSPLAFINSLTEQGSPGSASVMTNVDSLTDLLTQGPGLANLINGTQVGAVTELINFILDQAVAANTAYGIGTTKLFKITPTTVTSDGTFPHQIPNCTRGESVALLKGNLYYFYNTSTAGAIGKYNFTIFNDTWATGLQNAIHPSDKKEDILLFGDGRYVGTYFNDSDTLTLKKLDFGNEAVVADVLFNSGQWYLAVNSGIGGTNRTEGQIYVYDGAAITSMLSDEAGVGMQKIGFLYRLNGIIYVAYQDLSSTGFIIGYISGKQIKAMARFTGTLPTFAQKTLYKGTLLFLSGQSIYSAGAFVDSLPFQLSQHASGGYATTGALAAPFGTPMAASTDGGGNFKLAQFSGYDTNCAWKSIIYPMATGKQRAFLDNIVVLTKTLAAGASCSLTVEGDQNTKTSTAQVITGTGKRRHYFTNFGINGLEDLRIALDWSGGSASNDCAIRGIYLQGHWAEIAG